MSSEIDRSFGISIIISAILVTVTIGLHPAGGSIERLINITPLIVTTHLIAIISVPFLIYGFWGLTRSMQKQAPGLSTAAMVTFSLGMIAVMIAAAVNGLALPFFVSGLAGASEEVLATARLILSFSFSLNQAFDIIFIIFVSSASILWSIGIFRSKVLPVWISILGIISGTAALVALASGVVLTHLSGFRFFMAGFILWVVLIGILLVKSAKGPQPAPGAEVSS